MASTGALQLSIKPQCVCRSIAWRVQDENDQNIPCVRISVEPLTQNTSSTRICDKIHSLPNVSGNVLMKGMLSCLWSTFIPSSGDHDTSTRGAVPTGFPLLPLVNFQMNPPQPQYTRMINQAYNPVLGSLPLPTDVPTPISLRCGRAIQMPNTRNFFWNTMSMFSVRYEAQTRAKRPESSRGESARRDGKRIPFFPRDQQSENIQCTRTI